MRTDFALTSLDPTLHPLALDEAAPASSAAEQRTVVNEPLLDAYSASIIRAVERVEAVTLVSVSKRAGGRAAAGTGSGFAFTRDGYLLTNSHVVHGASAICMAFASGKEFDADLIGKDLETDVAVSGNSGGPLVNSAGEVVGLNTAMIAGARDCVSMTVQPSCSHCNNGRFERVRATDSALPVRTLRRPQAGERWRRIQHRTLPARCP